MIHTIEDVKADIDPNVFNNLKSNILSYNMIWKERTLD
jgi:hypothetical protein